MARLCWLTWMLCVLGGWKQSEIHEKSIQSHPRNEAEELHLRHKDNTRNYSQAAYNVVEVQLQETQWDIPWKKMTTPWMAQWSHKMSICYSDWLDVQVFSLVFKRLIFYRISTKATIYKAMEVSQWRVTAHGRQITILKISL